MTKKALYAGTFDPFTLGHLDIVKRARKLFDELIIIVAAPPQKKPFFPAKKRMQLIQELFADDPKVSVVSWDGLIVDFAKKHNVNFLVRGLRPTGDFDSEFQMATMNNRLLDKLETVFLVTGEDYYYVSSSLVKEIHQHGGDISEFVPKNIFNELKKLKG